MRDLIFITRQGTKIRRKDNQIVVYLNDNKIGAFPINQIKKLFLFGNIEISMPSINFLLSRDAEIYLLSNTGKFKGLITNTKLESNYNLRLKQYHSLINPTQNLKMAKYFVFRKIETIEKFTGTKLSDLKNLLMNSENYNEILGIEGTASAFFFTVLREELKDKNIGFEKREYRPAKDPVNASLSLVYSLYYSLLFSILQAKGYDPYIGYLHKKRGSHAVLVSDFMELFRVDLSKFVIVMFNNEFISKDNFTISSNGCYLKEDSLKKFLQAFKENYIDNKKYQSEMEKETKQFAEILQNQEG